MEKTLFALSSDGVTSYRVVFRHEDGKVLIDCNCPAGEMGKLCRHKLSLLAGDNRMLSDQKKQPDLEEVQHWLKDTRIPKLLSELRKTEKELERTKKRLSDLKRDIEQEAN